MNILLIANKQNNGLAPLAVNEPACMVKCNNSTLLELNMQSIAHLEGSLFVINGDMKSIELHLGNNQKTHYFQSLSSFYAVYKEAIKTAQDAWLVIDSSQYFSTQTINEILKHENQVLSTAKPVNLDIPKYHDDYFAGLAYLSAEFMKELIKNFAKKKSDFFTILSAFCDNNILLKTHASNFVPINYSWDILLLNELLISSAEAYQTGTIEPLATIKGKVILGKGSTIKNGAYIEGPVKIGENCTIGPNCYIRGNTNIGDNCKIGNAVEIKNSVIGKHVNIAHLSYIGDSIIDDHTNIGAGNITSNLRHDENQIVTKIDDEKINTNTKKLGVIIGKNVHTGINSSFYPGRKLYPNTSTLPGEIVKADKK